MKHTSNEAGTAAIEFALASPLLLALLLGITELGLGTYQAMQVADAAEAGALYAAKYGFNVSGIQAAVVNSVGVGSGVTATPAPVQFCGCPGASGEVAVSCSATCGGGSAPGNYIRVNAAIPHQTILSYPGVLLPATLTAQSTIRVS